MKNTILIITIFIISISLCSCASMGRTMLEKAEQGDRDIMYFVGMYYEYGWYGFKKDDEKALHWYKCAQAKGARRDTQSKITKLEASVYEHYYQQGLKFYNKNDFEGAIAKFEKIKGLDYENMQLKLRECYYKLGMQYYKKKDYYNANNSFYLATKYGKTNINNLIAECSYEVGLDHYQKGSKDGLIKNLNLFKFAKKYGSDKAEKMINSIIEKIVSKGLKFYKEKNYEKAIAYFKLAKENGWKDLQDKIASCYFDLGMEYQGNENYKDAKDVFERSKKYANKDMLQVLNKKIKHLPQLEFYKNVKAIQSIFNFNNYRNDFDEEFASLYDKNKKHNDYSFCAARKYFVGTYLNNVYKSLSKGTVTFPDGLIFKGILRSPISYTNGCNGIISFPNGIRFEGKIRHTYIRPKDGITYYPNGYRFEGSYNSNDNNPHYGKFFDANGNLEFDGVVESRYGGSCEEGTAYYPDGFKFTGDFKHNIPFEGKLVAKDGEILFEGEFDDDTISTSIDEYYISLR